MSNPIRPRGTRSLLLLVLTALALSVVAGILLTQGASPMSDASPMWHADGHWSHGLGVGWGVWSLGVLLVGLLVLVLLVVVPLSLVSRLTAMRGPDGREDPALELLREQYARGELDDDEFERRVDRLTSDR